MILPIISLNKFTGYSHYTRPPVLRPSDNLVNRDTVSISSEAFQASGENTNIEGEGNVKWRPPQEYPKGFPVAAQKELEDMANDPMISDGEYIDLVFYTTLMPQHDLNFTDWDNTPNKDVFMNDDFSLDKFIQKTLDEHEEYEPKYKFSDRFKGLLQRFT